MGTSTVTLATGTDDGNYSATSMVSTNKTETFTTGYQFFRFSNLTVPSYRRCVIDSASIALVGSSGLLSLATEIAGFSAQKGASAAVSSGPDATARTKTGASASANLNQGLLAGTCTVGITGVVAEAVNQPSWTNGSALTIFGQRVSLTGLGSAFTWFTADNGSFQPVLTVTWHPSGDVVTTRGITGVRAGRKTTKGATATTVGLTGARTGKKARWGSVSGVVALAGSRTGTARKRGSETGALATTNSRTGRAARRGSQVGSVSLTGVRAVRPARRGVVTGALAVTGVRTGKAFRRGAITGVAQLHATLRGITVRSGAVAVAGPKILAIVVRGSASRRAVLHGTAALTYQATGLPRRTTRLLGHPVVAGNPVGHPSRRGAVPGGARVTGSVTGRRGSTASVHGLLPALGTVTGAPRRQAATRGVVLLAESSATGGAHRRGVSTGHLMVHGMLGNADARTGFLAGALTVTGRDALFPHRAGVAAGGVVGVAGSVHGLAGRRGSAAPGVFEPSGSVAVGRTLKRGPVSGTALVSGQVGGHKGSAAATTGSFALPGTRTGRAARSGIYVGSQGMRVGPATYDSSVRRHGSAESGAVQTAGARNGRAGRTGASVGTVAHSGSATSSTGRDGAARDRAVLTGRTTGHATFALGVTGRLSGSGQVTGSRSDAVTVSGTARLVGVVRGRRATGSQVSGVPLRSTGNLAAATTRTGASSRGIVLVRGGISGRRGSQGATSGKASVNYLLAAPRDFSGGESGAATLAGRLTGLRTIPRDVAHTIVRVPVATTTYVTPAAVATYVAPKTLYKAPVPVVAVPRIVTTVTTTTPIKGKVVRRG